jgi:hypothetical protein
VGEENPRQTGDIRTPPTDPHHETAEPPAALPVDAEWRRIISRGLWLSAAATGISLVRTFFYYLPRFAPDSSVAPRLGLVTYVAICIAEAVAIWLFTEPDPGHRAARKIVALRWLAMLYLGSAAAILLSRFASNRDSMAHALVRVALASVHIPMVYLMFNYLQILARRMAARKLESAILVLLVGLITCAVFRDWLPWLTVLLRDMDWLPDRFVFWPGKIVWFIGWALALVDLIVKCAMAITFRRELPPSTESAAVPAP